MGSEPKSRALPSIPDYRKGQCAVICKRMHTYLVACIFAFLLAHISFAACKSCSESDKLCVPNSLIVVCQKLGIASGLEEMKTLCGYDEKGGVTLLGLQTAARAVGIQAVGMKIGLDQLAGFKGPAIAHLWGNHFVVVEAGDAGTIKVTDPPAEPKALKNEDFQKMYSGFALLIGKDASLFPKPKDEGPDLRLASYELDLGSIYQGESQFFSVKCRNAGSAVLEISKIEASCSCIAPLSSSTVIPPAGESEIKFLYDSSADRGSFGRTVFLSSNDPITPRVQVQIGGYVRSKTLRRSLRGVNFGEVRRSDASVREVYVPSTEAEPVRVLSVGCDSPFFSGSIAQSKQRSGTAIEVTLKPGAPVGPLKGKLLITTDHPFDPAVKVPIAATIKGNIDLDRDKFFLGLVKQGKQAVSNVTISTVGKDPFKITKIDNPLSCVSVDVKPSLDKLGVEGKEYVLTATLKPDAPLGNIKGEMVVHTNDPHQAQVKIPIYAYVEK